MRVKYYVALSIRFSNILCAPVAHDTLSNYFTVSYKDVKLLFSVKEIICMHGSAMQSGKGVLAGKGETPIFNPSPHKNPWPNLDEMWQN